MKRLLIPALEELETETNEEFEEIEVPENIDEALLLTMEADEDVQEEFENMDQVDETVDDVESAVERLENIAEIIRQHGISGPIMKVADPYRELVEAGLCKSYEELSDEPVIGEESEAVATGIDETVAATEAAGALAVGGAVAKTAGAAVGFSPLGWAVIAATATALTAIAGVALAKSMATHKATLKSVQKKLAEVNSFDAEKFKGMTKKVLSKEEFGRAIKGADLILKVAASGNLVKLAEDIEGVISSGSITTDKVDAIAKKAGDSLKGINTEDVKTIFGLEVEVGESGVAAVKSKAGVIKSKGNLGEKGWAPGDAKAAVEACIRVTSEGESLVKSVKSSASIISKIASSLKKGLKNEGADKAAAKAAVGQIKKILDAYKTIVKGAVNAVYKVNGTATQVAKAALSSPAKAE